jgi:D-xylose transport system substrate-binding protein
VADGSGLLQINGSPTDAAAGLIKDGIHRGLKDSGYKTLAEYDTPEWAPPKAQEWAAGQITRFGADIKGVVAANDGTGGGAIAAFKAAGVKPVPPITGNDATIAALQLIISGDQYNTISKPIGNRRCRCRQGGVPADQGRDARGEEQALRHAI